MNQTQTNQKTVPGSQELQKIFSKYLTTHVNGTAVGGIYYLQYDSKKKGRRNYAEINCNTNMIKIGFCICDEHRAELLRLAERYGMNTEVDVTPKDDIPQEREW